MRAPVLSQSLLVAAASAFFACATRPQVGGGEELYDIVVDTINGRRTAAKGPASYPACLLQVGTDVRRVWLAGPSGREADSSPAVMRAEAAALKAGMLVEIDWHSAVVHKVSDQELAVGAAVVYVPRLGEPGPVVVELRFRPASPRAEESQRRAAAAAERRDDAARDALSGP